MTQIGPGARELQGSLPLEEPKEERPRRAPTAPRSTDRTVADFGQRRKPVKPRPQSLAELVGSELWGWEAGMLAQLPDGGYCYVTQSMVDNGVPPYLTPALGDPETLRRLLVQVGRAPAAHVNEAGELREPGDSGPVRW